MVAQLKTGNANLSHPVERFPESNAIQNRGWINMLLKISAAHAVVEGYF
jgi:hypothetical protein